MFYNPNYIKASQKLVGIGVDFMLFFYKGCIKFL